MALACPCAETSACGPRCSIFGTIEAGVTKVSFAKDNHVVKATEIKHNDFTIYACTAWKCPNMIGDERVLARLPLRRN